MANPVPNMDASYARAPSSGAALTATDSSIQENPDGSVIVNFPSEEDGAGPLSAPTEHDANLAEHMDEQELDALGSDLVNDFEADKRSRQDWENNYKTGLPLLGFKFEERTDPWPKACGVYHPVLAEAVIRSQANIIMEIFPAKGPVKTQIIGTWTEDLEKQAFRIQREMNYQLLEVMSEYRSETEQLVLRCLVAGSVFRKVYKDPILKRPKAICVPAEDFVVPYGETELDPCERYTHVMKLTENQIAALVVSGLYRDVDLGESTYSTDVGEVQAEHDKIQGVKPQIEVDDRRQILEMHVSRDLPAFPSEDGLAKPYIITVDKDTNKVLSIYRNWSQDDPGFRKQAYFIHYKYFPGLGFYGMGLVHILGGVAKASTSALRQLIDAGTLHNLQAGYKTRGLRIKGDNRPLQPGELRDVDVLSGTLKDNIFFPPFRGPSAELTELLMRLVDEGRKIGSVADMQIGDVSGSTPVGTTLAVFERNMKVQSAVQARFHAAQRQEYKLLAQAVAETSARYDYQIDGDPAIKQQDFNDQVDIVPVSDPNAATMAQRIMQHQAALQLAQSAPQLYDMPDLHRSMLTILGFENANKLVPDQNQMQPTDPVSENMAILNMKPVKAFLEQDHDAHIRTHMAIVQDPRVIGIVQQSPNAQVIASTMSAHIQEHLGMSWRRKIEQAMGAAMPAPGAQLPPDVEANFSKAVADAADQVLENSKIADANKKAQEAIQDPVTQLQFMDTANKKLEIKRKALNDKGNLLHKQRELQVKSLLELAKIEGLPGGQAVSAAKEARQLAMERVSAEEQRRHERVMQQSELGHKVLDRMLQEDSKQKIAKMAKKTSTPQ